MLRQHAHERARWDEERERLLDRIMVLADKPPLMPFDSPPDLEPDDDVAWDMDDIAFAREG